MHVSATTAQSLERAQRFGDERKALRPVVSVAGEQPHSRGPTPNEEPEAIMLDFVNPIAAGRRALDGARQAGLAEIGKGTQTPQHARYKSSTRRPESNRICG